MARIRNAFKIRAADTPIIETSQFLQLYCPRLLEKLQREDLFVSKLIVVRGSPGQGKSSLLRLFETETLLAIHARKIQSSDRDLLERLQDLGVLGDSGPKVLGLYIQCDSSLRDIANLPNTQADIRLFNTLLDVRITVLFLRSIRRLVESRCLEISPDTILDPLPSGESPPRLFSTACSMESLENQCSKIESDFGLLLNSFPDDPVPESIQAHARVYSLSYLAAQIQKIPQLADLIPIVMLDDVQELYPEQRDHVRNEFIRRASVPRWLAVRTHVLGLEDLISIVGTDQGREYKEIALDEIFQESSVFNKFATEVVRRRLQHTESLQQVSIGDFKDFLLAPDDNIPQETAKNGIDEIAGRIGNEAMGSVAFQKRLLSLKESIAPSGIQYENFTRIEQEAILFIRQANRGQMTMFPELETPDPANWKTVEAARLFTSKDAKYPYYWGFDTLSEAASGNIEQLLSISASIVDRMIYRGQVEKPKTILAKDQEEMFRKSADDYYDVLEEKHRRGSVIRQFIDNLGLFCQEVTYRPSASIAPGVNGFGLTLQELEKAAGKDVSTPEAQVFREVITNAVAGNVLSIRVTKQGQPGSQKIVFYLNRTLCVRFRLPLYYGGFQRLPVKTLLKMMKGPVELKEMVKKGSSSTFLGEEEGK